MHLPSHNTHGIEPIESYKTYSASVFKQMVIDARDEEKRKLEIPGEIVRRRNNNGVLKTYAIPFPARNEIKTTHAFTPRIKWRSKGSSRKYIALKIVEENGDVDADSVWYNGVEYFKTTDWMCQKVHVTGTACTTNARVEISKENSSRCTIVVSKDLAKASQKKGSKKSIKVSKLTPLFFLQ